MVRIHNWEVSALDIRCNTIKSSLRDLVMGLQTSEKKQMFFSVDLSWNRQSFIFTCLPQHESEARSFIPGLLPYLRYKHGKSVDKFFTAPAIERHASSRWDEAAQCVANPEDEVLEELTNDDIGFDFAMVDSTPTTSPSQRPDPNRFNFRLGPNDDDSISTVGTHATTVGPRQPPAAALQPTVTPPPGINGRPAAGSVRISSSSSITPSDMSSASMCSRMTFVEDNMQSMRGTLDAILLKLSVTHPSAATQPGSSRPSEGLVGDSNGATGSGL